MKTLVTPAARSGTRRLPDDRALGWAEWGPPDGVPVLLSPGAATSRSLGFGPEAAAELDIRLISLDRPGIGASTAQPDRGFADFAADIAAFIAEAELPRCGMVGSSQGAPFALACAAEHVVDAVALVAGADEVAQQRFAPVLPSGMKQLVELAASDAATAERAFSAITPEVMWDMVISNSAEIDQEVYRQDAFAAAYFEAMREAFSQGPEGYARDTVLAMGHWDINISAIDIPVDIWYGEQDHRHSPDQGEGLAERIPGAVRHIVPGAGGAVLWTHPKPILSQLLRRLG